MTSDTKLMLSVAAALAAATMLSFGGATVAHAGSNDGGPFRYATQSNGPDRAGAVAYPEARTAAQIRQAKRARAYSASDVYGVYAADREPVPSAPVQYDFPRGAQGGW